MTRLAAIGLGANLPWRAGQPEETILAAMDDLAGLAVMGTGVTRSSLYRTDPVGFDRQPAFVNAAVTLRTALEPEALIDALLEIERQYGRARASELRNHPRTLDLDLLLMDDLVVNSPRLSLPHPALADRRFALAPLVEIGPELTHPILGKTMAELLAALPNEGSNRIGSVRKLTGAAPSPER